MKNKNTPWTAEEDAVLAEAIKEKISPARLSVRLKRSEGSIKRRMRELGLSGTRRGPRPHKSSIEFPFDGRIQAELWLEACRSGYLRSVMQFYALDATLECGCTGPAAYVGVGAIQEYWAQKLRSVHPLRFSPERFVARNGAVSVDYLSYEGKPVSLHLTFDDLGKIVLSQCGPRTCEKSRCESFA